MKINDLVNDYNSSHGLEHEEYYHFYRQFPFLEAVKLAFQSEYQGKLFPHQCRIGREKLNELANIAMQDIEVNGIKSFREFEEIYQFVDNLSQPGIGLLTKYDIALRIAAHCQISVDRVYCHAGTTVGARALGIKAQDGDKLDTQIFPEPLCQMRADHLENFLCIYKDRFKGLNKVGKCANRLSANKYKIGSCLHLNSKEK